MIECNFILNFFSKTPQTNKLTSYGRGTHLVRSWVAQVGLAIADAILPSHGAPCHCDGKQGDTGEGTSPTEPSVE